MTRPSILWITLDSIRADHTTMAGYRRDTTPNLDRLGSNADGRAFAQCVAHSNATLRSSASILTGMQPSRHDVGMGNDQLPDAVETVPERLAAEGYETACLSGNSHLSGATGLDRGFDWFEWLAASTLLDAAGPKTVARYLLNLRRHSAGLSTDPAKHSTPFLMNDVARRWLTDLADDPPFFCYLHYNEPHRPYYPPLPYLDRFTDDISMSAADAAEFATSVHRNFFDVVAEGPDFTDDEWAALKAMYDAEIAYTDEMVGRLVEHARSLADDLIVVVTADHGELFGEGGMLAHKLLLHDALLRVPLVVHGLDAPAADAGSLVQHADLMRTLVERAGGRTGGMQGVDLRAETREYAIAQRGPVSLDAYTDRNPGFDASRYPESALHCLRDAEFKYLRHDDGAALHRLPDEDADVSDEYPDVAERMDDYLAEWLESEGRPIDRAADAEFTDAMERQLRDLGYVE
jgi:uncharacterized sulfatase